MHSRKLSRKKLTQGSLTFLGKLAKIVQFLQSSKETFENFRKFSGDRAAPPPDLQILRPEKMFPHSNRNPGGAAANGSYSRLVTKV